jgi:hypothetical protein
MITAWITGRDWVTKSISNERAWPRVYPSDTVFLALDLLLFPEVIQRLWKKSDYWL